MSDTLSGFLLWSEPPGLRGALERLRRLQKPTEAVDVVEGWQEYVYTVDEHIPRVEMDGSPPYSHLLLLRSGRDRFIVLSNNYRVCDHFIEHDLRPTVTSVLRKADVAVHSLILGMAEFRRALEHSSAGDSGRVLPAPPSAEDSQGWHEFNLSHNLGYAFGRTDAFSGNLQKIEFEGDDLVAASLFVETFPVVRFRNCGIRKCLGTKGMLASYEVVKLGKSGFLSFSVPSSPRLKRERFREVEVLLRSINRWGFVK
jgi:hypothetical protein